MPRITSWLEVEKRLANYSNTLKSAEDRLVKTNDSLNIMLNSLIINLKDLLESQSDISLWFYDEDEPTTSNQPYISWTTPADHYGDFFYSRTKGLVYQFTSSGWNKLDDATLLNALALTNAKLESGDHERKIFLDNPVTPYESGDWWIRDDGTLYICQISRASGKREENDYIDALKYAQAVAKATDNLVEVLKGTMITTTDSAVVYEDKATHKTTTISGDSVRTGEIISNNYVPNTSGTKFNLNTGEILSKNFSIDSSGNAKFKGTVEATSGTFGSIITNQGLLTNLQFTSSFNYLGYWNSKMDEDRTFHDILVNIPSNFTIKSAYLTIISQPIKWWFYDEHSQVSTSYWGRPINLSLYKDNNSKVEKEVGGDLSTATYSNITQQTLSGGLFTNNSNTWTPTTPNDSSHAIQKIMSKDIKSLIGSGTTHFLVAPTGIPTGDWQTKFSGIGQGMAIINVYGFTQP